MQFSSIAAKRCRSSTLPTESTPACSSTISTAAICGPSVSSSSTAPAILPSGATCWSSPSYMGEWPYSIPRTIYSGTSPTTPPQPRGGRRGRDGPIRLPATGVQRFHTCPAAIGSIPRTLSQRTPTETFTCLNGCWAGDTPSSPSSLSLRLGLDPFDDQRRPHPSPSAHRHHPDARITPCEFMNERHHHPCASRCDGVAKTDAATVDVHH